MTCDTSQNGHWWGIPCVYVLFFFSFLFSDVLPLWVENVASELQTSDMPGFTAAFINLKHRSFFECVSLKGKIVSFNSWMTVKSLLSRYYYIHIQVFRSRYDFIIQIFLIIQPPNFNPNHFSDHSQPILSQLLPIPFPCPLFSSSSQHLKPQFTCGSILRTNTHKFNGQAAPKHRAANYLGNIQTERSWLGFGLFVHRVCN